MATTSQSLLLTSSSLSLPLHNSPPRYSLPRRPNLGILAAKLPAGEEIHRNLSEFRIRSAPPLPASESRIHVSLPEIYRKHVSLSKATTAADRPSGFTVVAQKKARKIRKIILKEDVAELGKKGQLMDVKAGYFRNYLFPSGIAQIVTPELLKEMKMEEERIEAEKKRVKEEAQQLALIFQTVGAFKVKRKGGKGKQIFGTVTAQDLVDIIKAQLQRDVDKRIVSLPEIRETGEYIAELKLHPEVTAQVRVNVFAN